MSSDGGGAPRAPPVGWTVDGLLEYAERCAGRVLEGRGDGFAEVAEECRELLALNDVFRLRFAEEIESRRGGGVEVDGELFETVVAMYRESLEHVHASGSAKTYTSAYHLLLTGTSVFMTCAKRQRRVYVQERLRAHELLRSESFWLESFFNKMEEERTRNGLNAPGWSDLEAEEKAQIMELEKNVAFAQLGQFGLTMVGYGVEVDTVNGFVEKMGRIHGLEEGSMASLQFEKDALEEDEGEAGPRVDLSVDELAILQAERDEALDLDADTAVVKAAACMELLFGDGDEEEGNIEDEEIGPFLHLCNQSAEFRRELADMLDEHRSEEMEVSSRSFFGLAKVFRVALSASDREEDYLTAMRTMHMAITFYRQREEDGENEFVQTQVNGLEIFHNTRFWNETFFLSMNKERQKSGLEQQRWKELDEESLANRSFMEKNIAFGQLGSFGYNMLNFGCSFREAVDFVEKMTVINALEPEEVVALLDNLVSLAEKMPGRLTAANRAYVEGKKEEIAGDGDGEEGEEEEEEGGKTAKGKGRRWFTKLGGKRRKSVMRTSSGTDVRKGLRVRRRSR